MYNINNLQNMSKEQIASVFNIQNPELFESKEELMKWIKFFKTK